MTSSTKLTKACLKRLDGVHPHLKAVIMAAAEGPVTFRVIEGVRSLSRQRQLVKQGASRTMRSRHIPAPNGLAHAVDLAVMIGGRISWEVPLYHRLAEQVKAAARRLGTPIEWGGDWHSFFDGPHFQLPWAQYPGTASVKDAAPPVPEPRELATIVPGSTGEAVRRLQAALIVIRSVHTSLVIDGIYGPMTRSAALAVTREVTGRATDIITLSLLERLEKLARKVEGKGAGKAVTHVSA